MKKHHLLFLMFLIGMVSFGQTHYNQKNGYVAGGYDVTAYFDHMPKEGKEDLVFTYNGAKFRFFSETNLSKFKADPDTYIPQYGGWCAYAIGKNGKKVKINPETYEIRDGKLYLFYDFRSTNTLESWLKEGPSGLKAKADENWKKITLQK
ncbi:MAG: YHS domain-containing (seleno)protein [Saonia sp.]